MSELSFKEFMNRMIDHVVEEEDVEEVEVGKVSKETLKKIGSFKDRENAVEKEKRAYVKWLAEQAKRKTEEHFQEDDEKLQEERYYIAKLILDDTGIDFSDEDKDYSVNGKTGIVVMEVPKAATADVTQ